MLFYTWQETAWLVLAAIILDWCFGDPKWLPHPVVGIGKLIKLLELRIYAQSRLRGGVLTVVTVSVSSVAAWSCVWAANAVHPWLGYAASSWLISTTMAVRGLKEAAMLVYEPLKAGNLPDARKYVGWIVGRDTEQLDEGEVTRATVETVAENIVDAFVSPLFFALLGAAPLAMAYRAANTLDSMVGYRNDRYRWFGWASARLDDALNYVPARITGGLLALAAAVTPGCSAGRSLRAVKAFARLHPSPNSGIPEAAVAGALGIELGGRNSYGGQPSERARLGWPLRPRGLEDIQATVRLMYAVSYFIAGGLLCSLLWLFA